MCDYFFISFFMCLFLWVTRMSDFLLHSIIMKVITNIVDVYVFKVCFEVEEEMICDSTDTYQR